MARKPDTYRVSTWQGASGWKKFKGGISKWKLREVLRELYSHGYTQMSLQVRAETHRRVAARWNRGFIASDKLPKSIRGKLMRSFDATKG